MSLYFIVSARAKGVVVQHVSVLSEWSLPLARHLIDRTTLGTIAFVLLGNFFYNFRESLTLN
jgi:hypothetical protein